jgi:hypothetical protein
MSWLMSAGISCAMALLDTGPSAGFVGNWLHGWAVSFAIGFPLAILLAPLIDRRLGSARTCDAGAIPCSRLPN